MFNAQKEFTFMANDTRKYDLTALETAWLKKSLETQRAAIVRNRNKEMAGSEIHVLRGKEIDQINNLLHKLA